MQVIEKIIDERLGFSIPVHHCDRSFKDKLTFQFYDSVRGSHTVLCDTDDKIESYIKENNVLCTIGEYPVYFTMSRDAVRLYESKIIDYISTRPSSSEPKLCVVATSMNNIFLDVEFKRNYRVGTNLYDLLLDGAELINSDGCFVLNSVYSNLEVVYNIKDVKRVNKLIVKHQILNSSKSEINLQNNNSVLNII